MNYAADMRSEKANYRPADLMCRLKISPRPEESFSAK
jgi:hypothetical protein